jgi:hypothetical protein
MIYVGSQQIVVAYEPTSEPVAACRHCGARIDPTAAAAGVGGNGVAARGAAGDGAGPGSTCVAVAWLSAKLVASESLSTHGGRRSARPGSPAGCVS